MVEVATVHDPYAGLEPEENALVEAVGRGEPYVAAPGTVIRAEVLIALIAGEPYGANPKPWPVRPYGVRVEGQQQDGQGRWVVEGRLDLNFRTIDWPVVLNDATIAGGVDLAYATTRTLELLRSEIGPGDDRERAFFAQGATIRGSVILRDATVTGCCDIAAATIDGQLTAIGATFANPGDIAIGGQGATIRRGIFLRGTVITGICAINGATIEGQFSAVGATVANRGGTAINGQGATIRGGVYLRSMPDDSGKRTQIDGQVSLAHATLSGLDCSGASITAAHQVALRLDSAVVTGPADFSPLSTNKPTSIDGAIYAMGAEFRGGLNFYGAHLSGAMAARAREDDPLPAAQGTPTLDDSTWTHTALDLTDATLKSLTMPTRPPAGIVDLSRGKVGTFTDYASGWPRPANLHSNTCDLGNGPVDARNDAVKNCRMVLDGFEYEHLDNPDGEPSGAKATTRDVVAARLHWLRTQPFDDLHTAFKPQPWKQLARVLAAQGDDAARRIAIEHRVALRLRPDTSGFERTISWLLHVLGNYGFNPWKTVAWSIAVILAFALQYWGAMLATCGAAAPWCADHRSFVERAVPGPDGQETKQWLAEGPDRRAFVRTLPADFVPALANPHQAELVLRESYPAFNPLLYSLDAFIPVMGLGTEQYWRPNEHTATGNIMQALYVAQQIIGAILITLIITGFTGLLTRDEK